MAPMGDAEKEPLVKIETCAVHREPLVRVDDHLVCPFRETGCTVLFRPKLPTPPYTVGEQAPRPLTVDRATIERFLAAVGLAVDEWQLSLLREVLINPAGLRATYKRRGESPGGFLAFGGDIATEVVDIPFARKPRRDANEVPPRPVPDEYGSLPVLDIDKLRDAAS